MTYTGVMQGKHIQCQAGQVKVKVKAVSQSYYDIKKSHDR